MCIIYIYIYAHIHTRQYFYTHKSCLQIRVSLPDYTTAPEAHKAEKNGNHEASGSHGLSVQILKLGKSLLLLFRSYKALGLGFVMFGLRLESTGLQ